MSIDKMNNSLFFYCPECHSEIVHSHTEEEMYNREFFDLTCQNCGHVHKADCRSQIDDSNSIKKTD